MVGNIPRFPWTVCSEFGNGEMMYIVKVPTKQRNLEGEIIMKTEYKTEDENLNGVSAGKLDSNGVTFRLVQIKEHEGTYKNTNGEIKPFYTAEGNTMVDGEARDFALVFGSAKLYHTLLKVVADHIKTPGQSVQINVSGIGSGFDRNYKVKIME
jgi:hypothetical protein